MKKIFILSLIALFLSSCDLFNNNIKIMCPTGAPALAFINDYSNLETNASASNVMAFLNDSSTYDIIVIDTISGINADSKYKLAATITFGNFYIAGTGNDTDTTFDKDDKVVVFAKSQTPGLLFSDLFSDFTNVEYVSSVTDAAKCLISKKNLATNSDIDYVLIAEPALTNALSKNKDAYICLNLQDEYSKKYQKSFIQASIFVNSKGNKTKIDKYLDKIKNDINSLKNTPENIINILSNYSDEEVSLKLGISKTLIPNVINKVGLDFKYVKEIEDDIKTFYKNFSNKKASIEDSFYK